MTVNDSKTVTTQHNIFKTFNIGLCDNIFKKWEFVICIFKFLAFDVIQNTPIRVTNFKNSH